MSLKKTAINRKKFMNRMGFGTKEILETQYAISAMTVFPGTTMLKKSGMNAKPSA